MTIARTAEIDLDSPQDVPALPMPSPEQVIAVMTALAKIIGARGALLGALIALFSLAWRVLDNPAPNALWALGIFGVIGFIPLALLNARKGV